MRRALLIALALLLAAPTWAAVPADTELGRLEAVVANLTQREINRTDPDDAALLLRIAEAFESTFAADWATWPADPANPTVAERAAFVLEQIRAWGVEVLVEATRRSVTDEAGADLALPALP